MSQLPPHSRIYRKASKDPLTFDQHMELSGIDVLRRIEYFSMVGALSQLDKSAKQKVIDDIPEPIPRPGDEKKPERKQIVVAPKDALNAVSRILHQRWMSKIRG